MAAAEGELPLSNPMRQLDSAKGDGCVSSGLEACHPGATTLDRTMILFDDVIEVLTGSH